VNYLANDVALLNESRSRLSNLFEYELGAVVFSHFTPLFPIRMTI
jgi:hypothetical protein